MVKVTLTRTHIPSDFVSTVTVYFVSREKALAAVATWNTHLWHYVIEAIVPRPPSDAGRYGIVCGNGQLI